MRRRSAQRQLPAKVFIVVGIVLIAFVNLLPAIWGLSTSFKSVRDVVATPPQLWGFEPTLDNYASVLSGSFPEALWASVRYGLVTTVVGVSLASLTAYALDRLRFPFRGAVYYAIIACVPLSIGASILIVPNYMYFTALGMGNQWYTLPLVYVALNLPIATWVMKGSIEAVPKELDDAATMDGLSRMGIFFRIILPLTRPGMFAAGMLVFIGSWNEFIFGTVLVQSPSLKPVQVAVYQFITAFGRFWGPLTAAAILAVIPVAILLILLGKYLVSGLMRGSVKG